MITPITVPNINWHGFVSSVTDITGYSPTRKLDESGIRPGDLKSYLQALATFEDSGATMATCFRDQPEILDHAHMSFLISIATDTFIDVWKRCDGIKLLEPEHSPSLITVAIWTGSLAAWKHSVLRGLMSNSPLHVRAFFTGLIQIFDRAGLSDLWRGYNRTVKADMVQLSQS